VKEGVKREKADWSKAISPLPVIANGGNDPVKGEEAEWSEAILPLPVMANGRHAAVKGEKLEWSEAISSDGDIFHENVTAVVTSRKPYLPPPHSFMHLTISASSCLS
jgi:hypothetical protein